MAKFVGLLILLIVVLSVDASIRAKRQFYGPGMGAFGPGAGLYGGGMYGPGIGGGLTPGQMIADRNLAIAQARGRQALLGSQMATNRVVQQANFNAALLGAEARSNVMAANARAMMFGK